MPNDNHYPAGAPAGKGGQFAPKNVGGQSKTQTENRKNAINYIPKTTSNGEPRNFWKDMSEEEKKALIKEYEETFSGMFFTISSLAKKFRTDLIDTRERNYNRRKWIEEEFASQLKNGPKKAEKKAIILLGLPGSGKSTIATPLMKDMGAFIVDADEFKKRIPEFQENPQMISAVHNESIDLSNKFMDTITDNNYNVIIGKVGGNYNSGIKTILDNLKEKGYEVGIILNDVPMKTTLQRSIERYKSGETDRLVPFGITAEADKNVFDTFDKALEHNAVTFGKIYNNDVPKGKNPILLHEIYKQS